MKERLLCLFLFCCSSASIYSQYFQKEKLLINKIENASSEAGKIKALGALADYYYIYRDDRKADSVLQKQLLLAEVSNDNELIRAALFNDAINNLNQWSSIETFKKALSFLDKGLKYASETGNDDYQAAAHLRKAALYRKKGDPDQALQQATLALSDIHNSKADSLKVMVYLEVGDIFLAKGDAVSAYKNYNAAYDIAYSKKINELQASVYHHFADLYQSLSNKELTKQSLLKSLEINKKFNNESGLLADYVYIARITDEKEYFDKVISLAEKLDNERYKLQGKRLMFAYLFAVRKSSIEAFDYLNKNEDLKQSYLNTGTANYYWTIGNLYRYANKLDSAIRYYSIAEPDMQKSFDLNIRKSVYKGLADCYQLMSQTSKAISYFEQAYAISNQQKDYNNLSSISLSLSQLYSTLRNYKKAFEFGENYNHFKDSLNELAEQRDVVMLEVDREKKRFEQDIADAEAHTLKVRNLQYMGISVVIAFLLSLLILFGMFPVSSTVVKMGGFVAFICLFEFIILLIDNWLHHLTHGEPLKIWLAKIVIIGLLLPMHHYIEHTVVHFLASKKLLRFKQGLSLKRILLKKKAAATTTTLEEHIIE